MPTKARAPVATAPAGLLPTDDDLPWVDRPDVGSRPPPEPRPMPTKERRAKQAAKARQGTVTFKMPVESERESEGSGLISEADAEIDEMDDDAGTEAQARIKRIDPSTGQPNYLGWVTPSLVNHRWLMEVLGGGIFRVATYSPDPDDGRLKHRKTKTYRVDLSIPPKTPPWAKVAAVEATPAAANVNGTGGDRVSIIDAQMMNLFTMQQQQHAAALEAQRAQQQQQMEMARQSTLMMQSFMERMATPAPPPPPPIDLMPLVTVLLTNRRDPVELLAELEAIRAKSATPTSAEAMMALVEKGMAWGARRSGGAAPAAESATDDGIIGLLKAATPEVVGLVKQVLTGRIALAQAQANGQRAEAPPSGPPVLGPTMRPAEPPQIAAPSAPTAESDAAKQIPGMPAWTPFVKPYVPELLQWATRDYDPATYATVLLNRIEDAGHLAIAEPVILDPAFPMALVTVFPELAPKAAWIGELFGAVREELTAPPDEGEEAGGEEEPT